MFTHDTPSRLENLVECFQPNSDSNLPFPRPLPLLWRSRNSTPEHTPTTTPHATPELQRRLSAMSPQKRSGFAMHLYSRLQAQEEVISFLQQRLAAKVNEYERNYSDSFQGHGDCSATKSSWKQCRVSAWSDTKRWVQESLPEASESWA